MMKKILVGLISIVVVAGAVMAATNAYFSSTATSNNNTFSTGTMDLYLSDSDETAQKTVSASFGGTNLKPGDTLPQQSLTVINSGTISGHHLDLTVTLTDNNTDLAKYLYFPESPDSYNGLRFGASTATSDSANLVTYLRGVYNDGDYDFYNGTTGASLFGVYSGKTRISLQDLADLGKIRIVPDSNNQGIAAGTTAYLWIHPVVHIDLTTQGETVTAVLDWELHQDTSQM